MNTPDEIKLHQQLNPTLAETLNPKLDYTIEPEPCQRTSAQIFWRVVFVLIAVALPMAAAFWMIWTDGVR